MSGQEQVRPLAPSSVIDGSTTATSTKSNLRRRKRMKCFLCFSFASLVPILTIVILIFTVFRVKNPIIKMNGATTSQLDLINGTQLLSNRQTNMTVIVDVSVKNPNFASFKYRNTTTTIYYKDTEVGEARGPAGTARARKTMRMNLTVEIMTDRMLSNLADLSRDLGSGQLGMSTYTEVRGRIRMMGIIKRHVTVKMNCTMVVNVTSQGIEDQKCIRKVDL